MCNINQLDLVKKEKIHLYILLQGSTPIKILARIWGIYHRSQVARTWSGPVY